jgi:hypothetical protein
MEVLLMAELLEQDKQTIRTAAYGAIVLVSLAYPGAISSAKSNIVGAKILTGATGVVGDVLSAKGKPEIRGGSTAEIARVVLPALSNAVATLEDKVPEEVGEFRKIVLVAAEQAAESTGGGTNAAEREMIEKIKAALGAGTSA